MTILKNKMQRRDFLRTLAKAGATTAFASQFMLSPNVFAASGGAKRFIMMYYPNGCVRDKWHNYNTGGLSGGSFDNSPLQPLDNHIDKILALKDITYAGHGGVEDHPGACDGVFSGGNVGGVTFNATIAEQLGDNNPFHLGLWTSQATDKTRFPFRDKFGEKITASDDPQLIYDNKIADLVGGGADPSDEDIRRKRVLESLHDNLDLLQGNNLNIKQQNKLLSHEEGLNFYQQILNSNINVGDGFSRPSVGMPIKGSGGFTNEQMGLGEDIAKGQLRNIAMAFQAGITRSATFQFMVAQDETLKINFPSIRPYMGEFGSGDKLYHNQTTSHNTSHNESNVFDSQTRWYNMMVAYLMDELAARPDAAYGGTLLDNTLILMMSENGGGNHQPENVGLYLAGGAGGALQTGNAIQTGNVGMSDLYVDIANALGLGWTNYGNSSGRSTGILT